MNGQKALTSRCADDDREFTCRALGLDGRGLGTSTILDLGLATRARSRWGAGLTGSRWAYSSSPSVLAFAARLAVELVVSLAPVTAVFLGARLVEMITGAPPVSIGLGALVVSFYVSIWLHECGHWFLARLLGGPGTHVHVLLRLGVVSLVRSRLSPSREISVIIAGPLVAALSTAAVAFVTAALGGSWVFAIVAGTLSATHFLQLFLPTGDGGTLARAVLSWRRQRFVVRKRRSAFNTSR